MIEYIGLNAITKLQKILEENSFKKIFLLTGKSSFERSFYKKIIFNSLNNFEFFHFNDFTPNPKINDIKKGLALFNKENYDVIIAIGGGSVIDMGKCVSILSTNQAPLEDFLFKKEEIKNRGIPLIRIPTTAGSGSEATHFAVVYMDKTKYSLLHSKYLQPEYVIVDPQTTYTVPKIISASTGMDALSQAIESFWNINSTIESKSYSKKAIKLIMKNLLDVVNEPNKKSRYNMAIAANYAGKAINITKTTACHSISYPISSYFNVLHGHAVALTLSSMIVFNSDISEEDNLDSRGVYYVKETMNELISVIGASDFLEAKKIINNLMLDIGLETKLKDLGIKSQEDIDLIVKNGFNPDRVINNPRKLNEINLRKILEEIK
ncbi:MAG: phosphonoacetaldehyde reductase [Promethearchaeota archaeon]